MRVTRPFAIPPRRIILGVPFGPHRRSDFHRLLSRPGVGRAAGVGVAGAAVASAGYLGWSVIRMASSVTRSVTSVAEVVEHGAERLDAKTPA